MDERTVSKAPLQIDVSEYQKSSLITELHPDLPRILDLMNSLDMLPADDAALFKSVWEKIKKVGFNLRYSLTFTEAETFFKYIPLDSEPAQMWEKARETFAELLFVMTVQKIIDEIRNAQAHPDFSPLPWVYEQPVSPQLQLVLDEACRIVLRNDNRRRKNITKQKSVSSSDDPPPLSFNQLVNIVMNDYQFNRVLRNFEDYLIESPETIESVIVRLTYFHGNYSNKHPKTAQYIQDKMFALQGKTLADITRTANILLFDIFETTFDSIFPPIPALTTLLEAKYRDQLPAHLKIELAHTFDESFREKFFDKNGGLLIDQERDSNFLASVDLKLEMYHQMVSDFIEKIAQAFAQEPGPYQGNGIKITGRTAAHSGHLDNPFVTGELVEHMYVTKMVNEEGVWTQKKVFIPEFGVYDDAGKLITAIPGSWKFLLQQGLLQSPSMEYSLSPRKIFPLLEKHPGLMEFVPAEFQPYVEKWRNLQESA